jgi:uncharacterized protein YdbL (DUF1318 family)
MKAVQFFRIIAVAFSLGLGSAVIAAENPNAVKARMEQRQGTVDALKDRGVAGESNRGFLEIRGTASAEDQRVISDENADRRSAYAYIASQTGVDIDAVGRRRAQQIALASKRGVWIQDPSGEWRQKG